MVELCHYICTMNRCFKALKSHNSPVFPPKNTKNDRKSNHTCMLVVLLHKALWAVLYL